jgi:hypothetical protein
LTNPNPANSPYFGNSVAAVGGDYGIVGGAGSTNLGGAYLFSFKPPVLSVMRSGGNVIVSWPKAADGFVLEQSITLNGWSQLPIATYQTNATSVFISIATPTNNKFYRLRHP